jgi:hypothetical protein
MERRTLLKLLLSTPLAMVIDYEKLLWVPEKTIFIPPPPQIFTYDLVVGPLQIVPVLSGIFDTGFDDYKKISREDAIKQGILKEGKGLEDIDAYMRMIKGEPFYNPRKKAWWDKY